VTGCITRFAFEGGLEEVVVADGGGLLLTLEEEPRDLLVLRYAVFDLLKLAHLRQHLVHQTVFIKVDEIPRLPGSVGIAIIYEGQVHQHHT